MLNSVGCVGTVGGLGGVGLRFFVKGLQEDTCTGVSFQVKMQAEGLQIYRKRDPSTGVFL